MGVTVLPLLILTAFSVQGIWSQGVQIPEKCLLDINSGMGGEFIKRFSFNRIQGECVEINYHGKGGNENRFETIEECEDTCDPLNPQVEQSHPKDSCKHNIYSGEFKGNRTLSYGFDRIKGKCVQFWYTGVGGNTNRFKSFKDCRQFCKSEAPYPVGGVIFTNNMTRNMVNLRRHKCKNVTLSELDAINTILNSVRSDIFDKYEEIQDNLLIEVALAIDKTFHGNRLWRNQKKFYQMARRVKDAVEKVLLNENQDDNTNGLVDEKSYRFFKTIFTIMNIRKKEKESIIEEIKEYTLKTISQEIIKVPEVVRDDIFDRINQVFDEYCSFNWRDHIFRIAHNVNYYVQLVIERNHN